MHARVARLSLICALFLTSFSALRAQSPGGGCENPGEFDFQTQVCPTGQGSASARYGPNPGYTWSTYQWTASGGTIVSGANEATMFYVPAPGATSVDITLAVTSPACSGTKTHTAVVTSDLPAEIHASESVCPYSRSSAMAMSNSGGTYQWSITNGTIIGSSQGNTIQFIAAGVGSVGLDVFATDSGDGCVSTGHRDIPITARTISIEQDVPSTCATAPTSAYVPPGQMPWDTDYWWVAGNAQIVGSALGSSINYIPDGTGPVTLTVSASSAECSATATRTFPLGTQSAPQIGTRTTSVCPGGWVTFTVPNAADFLNGLRWEYSGASYYDQTANSITLTPMAGSSYVQVTAFGQNPGCELSSNVRIPVRDPDATISAPAAVCPNTTFTASVPDIGSGGQYMWLLSGDAQMLSGGGDREVVVRANGPGPVHLSASVYSSTGTCQTTGLAEVEVGSALVPTIRTTTPFCGTGTASVDNAANYSSVVWTIQNGVFEGPNTGPSVNFVASGSAPVQLTATVSNAAGCSGSNSVTVTPQPAMTPALSVSQTGFCSTGSSTSAQVTNGPFASAFEWTLTNAIITYRGPGGEFIEFVNTREGDVVIEVSTTDSGGCAVSASTTIPFAAPPVPIIETSLSSHCGTATTIAAHVANASVFQQGGWYGYEWFVKNGYVAGQSGSLVTIQPTSSAPIEISVEVWFNGCRSRSTTVVPSSIPAPPAITFTPAEVCPLSLGSASVPASSSSYLWTIENGTIEGPPYGPSVSFRTNGTGPAQLSVTMSSPNSCPVVSTATVPVRVVEPPVVTFGQTDVCPNGQGSAYVMEQGDWSVYQWSIVNGTLQSSANNSYVYYTANGNGPVQLTLQAWTSENCTASTTVTQPLRTTAAPVVTFGQTEICPNGPGSAYVMEQGDWSVYQWSIVNGTLQSSANNSYVYYTANGNGPVQLTLQAWTSGNCTASTTVTQPLRTTAAPVVTFGQAEICPNGPGSAYVVEQGDWSVYQWSIVNGTLQSSANNSYVYYTANGNGPVQLTLQAWTSGNCTASTTVTQPLAAIATPTIRIGPEPTVCPNGTASAYVPESYANYTWSVQNGSIVSTSSDNTSVMFIADGSGPVVLSVQVTSAAGCTTSNSVSVPLRTIEPPVLSVGPQPDMCAGGTSSAYVAADYASYVWSIQNGTITSTSADNKSVMFNADGTGAVSVSVTVTTGDGCSSSNSATIPLRTIDPPVISTGPQGSVCAGGSGSAYVAEDYASYVWSIQNGTINSTSADGKSIMFTATATATDPVALTVAVTSLDGCSASNSATVPLRTVTPATVTASGATTFCEGDSVTLTAPSAESYAWSNGATTQSIAVNATGSYSVTVTNANGCSATSAATNVTVNLLPATPVITGSGATTFCEGGSVTLTASAADAYAWSNGATTQSITVNAPGSYTVTVTNANGCSATSAATNVTVNPLPATPVITGSGATTFCEGGSVTLTAPAADSYSWSNGATTQSITVNASGSYSVTVTNANGCSATSVATNVTVNAQPATPVITASGATTFCEGGSVTLTAAAASSYAWSNGATTQSITVSASGAYTVTVTNANGCSATSAATTITVNAQPAAPVITASGATTFCEGGSVTLTAPAASSYAWSNGATTQSITVSASGAYTVTVTNANGCSATSGATTVTVNAPPATPVITASGPTALCPGAFVTLTAPAGFVYAWSNGATTQSIAVSTAGSYSVTVTNTNGCSTVSAPVAVTNYAPTTIAAEPQSVTMPRQTTRVLTVTANGAAPLQYQWFRGSSGDTSDPVAGQTSASVTVGPYHKKGTYRFWVRVWSDTCPTSTVNSTTAQVTVN